MCLQAFQHTGGQVSFFQHDRMIAAVLLSCWAVIVDVLFPLDSSCLSGHTPSATTANQQTGEQIYLVPFRCCSGVQSRNLLNQVKVPPADNRVMGVLCANPFFGRLFYDVLYLVVVGFLLALQQNAGIGFFLQNADNRLCGPLGIRSIRKPAFGVRQAPADLVSKG